jgi:DMSO reductase iron-sulfur subunit
MTKAIITDLNRCVGCLACSVACKAVNNVPIGSYWNKVVRVGPNPIPGGSGQYPDVYMYFLPISCQHCENPECVKVCPTEASHVAEDGSIQIDKEKCIGCQFCVMACPYGVRAYDTSKDKGVIEKCTMCAHLIDKGEKPACVKHCPGQARKFGDLDDPESDVSKLRAAKKTYKLKDVGNHPGVDYAMDKCAWKGDE